MTREEEIIEAARSRAERHQIAEMELYRGDKCNYSYGRIYNSEIASFESGVKWADEHPKNVWHSIDVEPKKGSWFLGQIGDNAYDTFIAEIEGKSMKDWLIGCNIKQWVYISDLLPKTK